MVYKKIKVYKKGYLDVGDGHKIYYELCGNPNGKPVMFIHGGPGGGFVEDDKHFFNPKIFNIIMFDQRGSGKSTPFATLENNTTFKLVSDIKKLLNFLQINKTFLFGGSWGSTLSLVYAIKHPKTVAGMILRGIYLGRKGEEQYGFHDAQNVFPEAWEKMISLVPDQYKRNILDYYYQMLTSKNPKNRKKYALTWATYELSISKLRTSEHDLKKILNMIKPEAFAKIEVHYLINHCFLPKNYILRNIYKLKDIPISIVHGRYDHVASPRAAYILHKHLPKSKLYYTFAGHSAHDPETKKRLVKEMDKFGKLKI